MSTDNKLVDVHTKPISEKVRNKKVIYFQKENKGYWGRSFEAIYNCKCYDFIFTYN
jgi:hypothetical protein